MLARRSVPGPLLFGRCHAVAPAAPLPGSGVVPTESARGHRLYVAGDIVACSRCGAYSARGTRSQLYNLCDPEQLEDTPQRKWRRDNFMAGIHPKGAKSNPAISVPRPLEVTDEAVQWLGLISIS